MPASHRRIGGATGRSWRGPGLAAMQADQLVAALGACQSPDPAVRKAAEEALNLVRAGRAAGRGPPCHAPPPPPLPAARRAVGRRPATLLRRCAWHPAAAPVPWCSTSTPEARWSTCCVWRWRTVLTRQCGRWQPSRSKTWSSATGPPRVRAAGARGLLAMPLAGCAATAQLRQEALSQGSVICAVAKLLCCLPLPLLTFPTG